MKHKYKLGGVICNGCRSKIENAINSIEGVQAVVTLTPAVAEIMMNHLIPIEQLQSVLSSLGNYTIEPYTEDKPTMKMSCCDNGDSKPVPQHNHLHNTKGDYYCPMHCEVGKTYDKPGNCPVCGMNLEPVATADNHVIYTCQMHPEIVRNEQGNCPICGMNLVPMAEAPEDNSTYKKLLHKFWIAIIFTLPVFILSMGAIIHANPLNELIPQKVSDWLQFAFSLPVVFYAAWMFFQRAWVSIKKWKLNMFTLIGLGSAAAFIFSLIGLLFPDIFPEQFKSHSGEVFLYFEAVTVILTLVLLGQVLEAKAHSKTNSAIKELMKLTPTIATIVVDGQEKVIDIKEIKKGDVLRVKPGERIPVDGYINVGNTLIDESMITGEPIPVDKVEGDRISSGTINGTRSFTMVAENVGNETLLAHIIEMVEKASHSRAPIQKLADKISGIFVPIVVGIAVFTFIAWAAWGGSNGYMFAFSNAIAVLIIACPCALGLATPISVMIGIGKGAQNGILIKDAETLQRMDRVNVLLTDKTGTLTEGHPTVESVHSTNSFTNSDLLKYAAAISQNSEHPLSQAIVRYAKMNNVTTVSTDNFEAIVGQGVMGRVDNKDVALGNVKLISSHNISIPPEITKIIGEEQSRGKTAVYLRVEDKLVGYIIISDRIKRSSGEAIKSLIAQGVKVVMLTGDNKQTAQNVASELGVSDFIAECQPSDKLKEIERLKSLGNVVAMVGDGINDAPALAAADIGIAMGTGTDVAIQSAGVTLVKGDLWGIVKTKTLSHATMRNIKENLFFAFVYNLLGILIASGILYPIFGWLLSPMIAAAAMSFSSVSVIFNALRLKRVKL